MEKIVVGVDDNSLFNVSKGKKCKIIKSFWENGEGWYKLKDIQNGEIFESPDIFWELEIKEEN